MTESDIATIESRLGLTIPKHYRDFLLDYPQVLIDTKLDLGWSKEAPAGRQLHNNADRLVELNKFVRFPGTPWVGEAGDPWPGNYFVIGDDQCGDYWCLDLLTNDHGVWFYDHDNGAFERQHNSIQDFGRSLIEEIVAFNRERSR
jgi:hypothetical protein